MKLFSNITTRFRALRPHWKVALVGAALLLLWALLCINIDDDNDAQQTEQLQQHQSQQQVRHPVLRFTYEQGDVIGGFAVQLCDAITKISTVQCVTRENWADADFFWFTSYRPNKWDRHPPFQSVQKVWYNLEVRSSRV
jgi:hypothetical protein